MERETISLFGIDLFISFLTFGAGVSGLMWFIIAFNKRHLVLDRRPDYQVTYGIVLMGLTLLLMDFIIFGSVLFDVNGRFFQLLLTFMMGVQIAGAIAIITAPRKK